MDNKYILPEVVKRKIMEQLHSEINILEYIFQTIFNFTVPKMALCLLLYC